MIDWDSGHRHRHHREGVKSRAEAFKEPEGFNALLHLAGQPARRLQVEDLCWASLPNVEQTRPARTGGPAAALPANRPYRRHLHAPAGRGCSHGSPAPPGNQRRAACASLLESPSISVRRRCPALRRFDQGRGSGFLGSKLSPPKTCKNHPGLWPAQWLGERQRFVGRANQQPAPRKGLQPLQLLGYTAEWLPLISGSGAG